MALPAVPHLSFEDYLAAEEASDVPHELVGGVAFAMTGGTARHSLLVGAIFRAVSGPALAAGCRPHQHMMKLKLGENTCYYPDVMVACGPLAGDDLFEVSPVLLVEVSSPSSIITDRRELVGAYLSIPSLLQYLIFDQHQPVVEVHERQNGRWQAWTLAPGDVVPISHPPMILDLDDLYRDLPA